MTTTETIIDKSADNCPFCQSKNITPLTNPWDHIFPLLDFSGNRGKLKLLCTDCRKAFYIQYCPECGGTTTLRGAYSEALDEGYSGFECDDPKCKWDDIS